MYDFHTHSSYSDDSKSTMDSMIKSATAKGLNGICLTDHLDIDYPNYNIQFTFKYDQYTNEIERLQKEKKYQIQIYKGIELGLQPHILDQNSDFLKDKEFDFIIGSIHCVNKKEMYGLSYLESKSDIEGIEAYFKDLIHCIDNFSDFDVLGHLDVFRRYLKDGEKSFVINKYYDYIEYILKKIVLLGKGIEINTSGKRYGLSSFHPIKDILLIYKECGGEIFTLGSDAHKPEDIGYCFREAKDIAKSIGFNYYSYFKNRKPNYKRID